MESHICKSLSKPAVANWGMLGWAANPHNSSVCPKIMGKNPNSPVPVNMQLRVVPIRSWDPLPSDITLMPP